MTGLRLPKRTSLKTKMSDDIYDIARKLLNAPSQSTGAELVDMGRVLARELLRVGTRFAYVVILSHTMDDIPMAMFSDWDLALEYANEIDWDVSPSFAKMLALPDCSTPSVISILTFRNGRPCSRIVVREYEEEENQYSNGDDDCAV